MLRQLSRARHARPPKRSERRLLSRTSYVALAQQTQSVRTSASSVAPAANAVKSTSPVSYIPNRLRAKNALRDLSALLPRIVDAEVLRNEGWPETLDHAVERLSEDSRKPTIAVWGPQSDAARDVITALLEDPLSSDDSRRTLLARRWDNHYSNQLSLSYSSTGQSVSDSEVTIGSSWLHETNATILELSDHDSQGVTMSLLDVNVVVLALEEPEDILATSIRSILNTHSSQGSEVHILINNQLAKTEVGRKHLQKSFDKAWSTAASASNSSLKPSPPLTLHLVYSEAAIDAQAQFRRAQLEHAVRPSASAYSQALSRFQQDMADSGIPNLSQSLQRALRPFSASSEAVAVQPAIKTASAAAQRAQAALSDASAEVFTVEGHSQALRTQADAYTRALSDDLFRDRDLVAGSTEASRQAAEAYLSALSWWKLIWRVDELASDLAGILTTTYGRSLERQLVYQTGRISSAKNSLDTAVDQAVAFPKTSPFHSPLLLNSLDQLSSSSTSPASQLSPTSLITPIQSRLQRLTAKAGSPVAHLHVRAQMLLIQTYALSIGGPGAAWGAWAVGYASEEIALGAGVLSAMAGVRWAVGRWERAKRRWRESLTRVDEGLERDLQIQYVEVMRDAVVNKAAKAADGLDALATRRRASIEELSAELGQVQENLKQLEGSASQSK
ncbi:hypothetical protein DL93DRAFT_2228523 [Clavulina sp. PMI_390]|nr:hypothetical protein DL93DRAFT_2228523 [Clavulina sp. PMI_390]